MERIEKEDIQGLLVRGYKYLSEACYQLLHFSDTQKAKVYLNSIKEKLRNAESEPQDIALNFAFTYEGIERLQLPAELLNSFSRQFKEGITDDGRRLVLGDVAANSPDQWQWGNHQKQNDSQVIHGLLMIYAKDKATLNNICQSEKQNLTLHGISEVRILNSQLLPDYKEHFGFRDGISQPTIEGLSSRIDPRPENTVKPGEFILGYVNQYNQLPDSPYVLSVGDSKDILPAKDGMLGIKDFGKNGSYMVFRQMSQDVPSFWKYLKEHSAEPGNSLEESAIALGAKMVGRQPDGKPLVKVKENLKPTDDPLNTFNYFDEDSEGVECPFGAHIRRTNPRDYLVTNRNGKLNEAVKEQSAQMIAKHRILRRGRSYGEPLAPSMKAEDLMNASPDGKDRGLHFICFAGDLVRQFEFVQNAWAKFHKFGGLYNDSDPIIGTRNIAGIDHEKITADDFTVPDNLLRRRYHGLPQFTQMKGGAYFFFPGIRAFKYLCELYKD